MKKWILAISAFSFFASTPVLAKDDITSWNVQKLCEKYGNANSKWFMNPELYNELSARNSLYCTDPEYIRQKREASERQTQALYDLSRRLKDMDCSRRGIPKDRCY